MNKDNKIFFAFNNTVMQGIIQKESKRGTSVWIKPLNSERKKNMLVSYSKVFNTFDETKNFVDGIKKIKTNKINKLLQYNK